MTLTTKTVLSLSGVKTVSAQLATNESLQSEATFSTAWRMKANVATGSVREGSVFSLSVHSGGGDTQTGPLLPLLDRTRGNPPLDRTRVRFATPRVVRLMTGGLSCELCLRLMCAEPHPEQFDLYLKPPDKVVQIPWNSKCLLKRNANKHVKMSSFCLKMSFERKYPFEGGFLWRNGKNMSAWDNRGSDPTSLVFVVTKLDLLQNIQI